MVTRQALESQAHWICECCLCLTNRRISDTTAQLSTIGPFQNYAPLRWRRYDEVCPETMNSFIKLLLDAWLNMAYEFMRKLS